MRGTKIGGKWETKKWSDEEQNMSQMSDFSSFVLFHQLLLSGFGPQIINPVSASHITTSVNRFCAAPIRVPCSCVDACQNEHNCWRKSQRKFGVLELTNLKKNSYLLSEQNSDWQKHWCMRKWKRICWMPALLNNKVKMREQADSKIIDESNETLWL